MNIVYVLGRLGKDVELKYLPNGIAVAEFSVATTEKFKEKERTDWHSIIVYGKLAEICSVNLKKGHQVFAMGKLQTRSWDTEFAKQYKTEIIVKEIRFLSSPVKKNEEKESIQNKPTETEFYTEENVTWTTDEIPF